MMMMMAANSVSWGGDREFDDDDGGEQCEVDREFDEDDDDLCMLNTRQSFATKSVVNKRVNECFETLRQRSNKKAAQY